MPTRHTLLALLALCLSLLAAPVNATELKGWLREGPEYPQYQGLQGFFERLKTHTGGRYEGKIVCCDQLGGQAKVVPIFKRGEVDVALFYSSALDDEVPEVSVLGLPFLFRGPEHMMNALRGEAGKELEKMLAPKGYTVLAWFDGGSRSFYARQGLLQNASDFSGKKVRMPKRQELQLLTQAMGGTPVDTAFDKLPAAFKNGEVDVAENDLTSYYVSEHYKAAPYYTLSQHVVQPVALVVSQQLWQKLNAADRAAFQQAAADASDQALKIRVERDAELRAKLQKAGVKFGEFKGASTAIAGMSKVYAPVLVSQKATDLMMRIMAAPTK